MKIIGIGDNVMDAYLHQKKLYPGGNSVNVPVLAQRYGCEAAAYIGVIGNDPSGQHFLAALEQENIDVSRLRIAEGITARNFISLDENGDRHFVGNNGSNVVQYMFKLALNYDDYRFIEQYSVVHTSVHSFIDDLLPAIQQRAPISLDFSDGYNETNIAKLAPLLHFAFFSGGDKSETEVEELADYATKCGARTVVVTLGTRGSYVRQGDRTHRQPCVPADVIDALGAGDSYIAAFLAKYDESRGDIESAARAASEFAAQCCMHYGAFGREMDI